MKAPSKVFLLFFLLPDWLKLNHLKSRTECGFSDIFSRHTCFTVAETIGVTNYAARFGAKNVQKSTFEIAEMVLGPCNQQTNMIIIHPKIKWTRSLSTVLSLWEAFATENTEIEKYHTNSLLIFKTQQNDKNSTFLPRR